MRLIVHTNVSKLGHLETKQLGPPASISSGWENNQLQLHRGSYKAAPGRERYGQRTLNVVLVIQSFRKRSQVKVNANLLLKQNEVSNFWFATVFQNGGSDPEGRVQMCSYAPLGACCMSGGDGRRLNVKPVGLKFIMITWCLQGAMDFLFADWKHHLLPSTKW